MSSVVISGDTSGTVTVTVPAVAGTNTATLPAATGTVMVSGNMPAFSAYAGSNQNLSAAVSTKIQFNAKVYDTANCYDTTNYRFTPNVAGYYLISANYNSSSNTACIIIPQIYVNGGAQTYQLTRQYCSDYPAFNCCAQIYLNGSTDYIEIYVITSANTTSQGGLQFNRFSASLVRAA